MEVYLSDLQQGKLLSEAEVLVRPSFIHAEVVLPSVLLPSSKE
jgi:hypothetical protein